MLESGEEVKLQRNALSVIAVPATVDPDTSEDENKTLLLQNQQVGAGTARFPDTVLQGRSLCNRQPRLVAGRGTCC